MVVATTRVRFTQVTWIQMIQAICVLMIVTAF